MFPWIYHARVATTERLLLEFPTEIVTQNAMPALPSELTHVAFDAVPNLVNLSSITH